jgi:hypothetical protein
MRWQSLVVAAGLGLAAIVGGAMAVPAAAVRYGVVLPLVGGAAPPTPQEFDTRRGPQPTMPASPPTTSTQSGKPATATPAPTAPAPSPGSALTIAALLASPPPVGQSVEVDAYYAGAAPGSMPMSRPSMMPGRLPCPFLPEATLTDRPFPPGYQVLNSYSSNVPPDDAPWLMATTPEALADANRNTVLPYHARLRGHLGDPRLATCPHADRAFVVDAVVATYPDPPPTAGPGLWSAPLGYDRWAREHDERLGMSVAAPPGWRVEPLADPSVLGGLALRSPDVPAHPVLLRVHHGETWYDWLAPAVRPPILEGADAFGPYSQGSFPAMGPSQGLSGYQVSRRFGREAEQAVLFNGGGRTYELVVRFPLGYDVPQPLLTAYTAIVASFALDQAPGPTPTPPIRQTLGPGPFISQEQALELTVERHGGPLDLVTARLVPEAAARSLSGLCGHFNGHPDGVWLLNARGDFQGRQMEYRFYVEATTGAPLCGEPADAPRPFPTWTPGGRPTRYATATPVPTQALRPPS